MPITASYISLGLNKNGNISNIKESTTIFVAWNRKCSLTKPIPNCLLMKIKDDCKLSDV